MRSRTCFSSLLLVLLAATATAQAEQSVVELTPKFAPGKPLTVEVRNLSKLTVTLSEVTLHLSTEATGAAPCTFSMPQPVVIGPAQMMVFSLGANRDVLHCIPHPVTKQLFVITARDLARMAPRQRPARAILHHADVTYKMQIGKHAIADKTTWHLAVE